MCEREQRGLAIAALCKLTAKGGVWLVPSQSGKGKYTVCPDRENPHCTCPDYESRAAKCKHIFAVEFVVKREAEETVEIHTVTLTEKRPTYKQNWPAYNAAQVNEKHKFQTLLHDLCKGIEEPEARRGRPRIPLADAIFAACFKVYSTVSGRRFMCDLRDARDKGFINRLPCYNSIFNIFESEDTFDVLRLLVVESATPLKALETKFACDSSGFSGSRFDRWIEYKYGKPMKAVKRAWVKAHVMTGVKTNVVSAVEIHDQYANDGAQFKPLLDTTSERFSVDEVSADLAYSTRANLEAVDALGATPLIPFKSNATPTAGGLWAKMYHYVALHRDEFLNRYHLRSNVESTFSMVKAKFGDGVRSKCDVAMKNEVLAKLVCHNICCLIAVVYETGLEPTFWAESTSAQKFSEN
ncbi:MAG: transposase [Planctomycetes bacterium]|nr:transposase [Planctomycetota bacterium]